MGVKAEVAGREMLGENYYDKIYHTVWLTLYLWLRLPIFHSSTGLVSIANSLPVSRRLIKSDPLILPT